MVERAPDGIRRLCRFEKTTSDARCHGRPPRRRPGPTTTPAAKSLGSARSNSALGSRSDAASRAEGRAGVQPRLGRTRVHRVIPSALAERGASAGIPSQVGWCRSARNQELRHLAPSPKRVLPSGFPRPLERRRPQHPDPETLACARVPALYLKLAF